VGGPVILADLPSPAAADVGGLLAVLPIGSIEQHAGHLPVGTDAILVDRIASGLEAALPDQVLLMPTLWYGASDHHAGLPGTVSIGTPLVADVVNRAVTGLAGSTGVTRFLILNGHGGNEPAMRTALEAIARAAPHLRVWAVSYWEALFDGSPAEGRPAGPMGHADRHEASLVMAARPDLGIRPGPPDRLTDGLPGWVHTARGFEHRTLAGGVGDPTGANAAEGERFLALTVASLRTLIGRLP
jgi:creatinine amidohydrolase